MAMIEQEVRQFLATRFPAYSAKLRDDEPLDRVVDSLGLFDLVEWIENHYSARIPHEEFSPRRFGTIGGIVSAIREFQSPQGKVTDH